MGAAPTAAASRLEERKKLRRENMLRNDLLVSDMVVAPWCEQILCDGMEQVKKLGKPRAGWPTAPSAKS
jgi:hypothetical protein